MKHLKHLFTALLLLCTTVATANDFEVDGIYYNITGATNKTVAVTYKGSWYDDYSYEYNGDVVIPESVTYRGTTYSVTSIGNRAFEYCYSLTSVEIPNSVTSIGEYAFYGCFGLTSIVVAEGNNVYDSRDNCNAIIETATNTLISGCKNTVIPNSVTSIGDYAFAYCSGLTSVEIGNSVTSVGNYAFYGCEDLTSIEIPSSVTSIGEEAFGAYYSVLTDVHINDLAAWCKIDFSSYDANPLYYAENLYLNGELLTELVIPDGVTSIGNYAFEGCSGLTSVEIPNCVTSIGEGAFERCWGLTSVEIPKSVTSIGNDAFSDCSGLTSMVVAEGNKVYDSRDNCNAIIETATNTLISGCKNTVIPNSVTSIGYSAFSGCWDLTSIEIPNSVTSIGSGAFYNCSGLTNIEIPSSVTSIGDYAFYNCSGLKTVYNFSNLTFSKGSSSNGYVAYYANKVFNIISDGSVIDGDFVLIENEDGMTLAGYLGNTTELTLPTEYNGKSITSIGKYAFEGCSGLTSVVIGNSVTSIEERAFYTCSGLTSVVIGNNVTSIDNYAFYGCSGLKTVYNFSNLTFSKGSSSNGYVAYYANKVINIPNGFIDGDIVWAENEDGMTLAYYLGNTTELTLPAEYNGKSVTGIGNGAFRDCTGLTSNLVIPNRVTSIGSSAFEGCTNIEKLYISNSLESIGDEAFAGCEKIMEIKIGLEKPIRGAANIFADAVYDNAILYVPTGTKSLYEKREPWNIFFYVVEMDFTGIDEVKAENGQVEDIYYDLSGRAVESPANGIYIINGKKVWVK